MAEPPAEQLCSHPLSDLDLPSAATTAEDQPEPMETDTTEDSSAAGPSQQQLEAAAGCKAAEGGEQPQRSSPGPSAADSSAATDAPEQQAQAAEAADSFPEAASPAAEAAAGPSQALSRQCSAAAQRANSWALREGAACKRQAVAYSWGRGEAGQLGQGNAPEACESPQAIQALEGRDVVHAAGSLFHSAFLTGDGDLLVCGANESGQLGVKGLAGSENPTRVVALDAVSVHAAACGLSHTLTVVGDGLLASCGANDLGQLGQGSCGPAVPLPRLLKRGRKQAFARVAAGEGHSLALTSAGLVAAFGDNAFGQLGLGDTEPRAAPTEVPSLWPLGIVQVACGATHSCCLAADGRLFAWGRGKYGQLGLGSWDNAAKPQAVALPGGARACQVACGGDHTLAVGSEGELFAWGRGTWGQTGQGGTANLASPTRVAALAGERVLQASAGARHSLVLTAAGEVWAFGCNEFGQLGLGDRTDRPSPARLAGFPQGVPSFLVAAGDHSLAVCRLGSAEGFVVPGPEERWGASLMPLRLPSLASLAAAAGSSKQPQQLAMLRHALEDMLACPGYLIAQVAAPEQPGSSGSGSGSGSHGLDLAKITGLFTSLLRVYDTDLLEALLAAAGSLAERIHEANAGKEQGDSLADAGLWMRALFILLQNPLNSEGPGKQLMRRLVRAVAACAGKQQLMAWLGGLAPEVFAARNVRPLQKYLASLAVRQGSTAAREELVLALHLLLLLHNASEKAGRLVSAKEFYNQTLSDSLDLQAEYLAWLRLQDEQRQKRGGGGGGSSGTALVSVCQTPFALTPPAKGRILQLEAAMQKQAHFQTGGIQALMQGIDPAHLQFLDLRIRREHLLEDTVAQVLGRSPADLKKPLRVTFASGGVPEEGLDQGGVTKEFFQLLTRELFNEAFGMFAYDAETRTFWFEARAADREAEYRLVGSLIGLAVYSSVILDVHFPMAVYKKLLRQPLGFEDLRAAFPELGRGLQQLLDFEGDVEGTFCRTFAAEIEYFGETRSTELLPGGAEVPVTASNRGEFVRLYTKWLLHDSVAAQFAAFAHGFHEVCGGPALSLFRPEELELLICGLPHLDFGDLQSVARYDGGFHAQHPTVQAFWAVLQGLGLAEKKLFLKFTTGCDRAPVGGLGSLELVIQRSGPDTEALPTAHTCFNYLLLPEYASAEKLRRKLLTAINNAEGFGLQ